MQEEKEKIKLQHIESYKKAIIETIKNNTNSLIDDDIMSLIKKPPLDSMDQIKSKFLDLAKMEVALLISKYEEVYQFEVDIAVLQLLLKFFVVYNILGHHIYDTCRWASNLHKVDEYDFPKNEYNRSGFYAYDEWGYHEIKALAWQPIEDYIEE